MKKRILVTVGLLFLLNSCIIKSLNPFYTLETVVKDDRIIGEWKSGDDETWKIVTANEFFKSESKNDSVDYISINFEAEGKYMDKSYIAQYIKDGEESSFLIVPFEIQGIKYLDFTPLIVELENVNDLLAKHLVQTHSLAKITFDTNEEISLKWFDESAFKELTDQNRIKIKHQVIGFEESVLLTVSPAELQKLIKKYTSNDRTWEKSNDYKLTLKHAKP